MGTTIKVSNREIAIRAFDHLRQERKTSFHASIIQNDPDGAQGMEKIIC